MKSMRTIAVEIRHNDEALGRVYHNGAVEVHDEVPGAEPRFWIGARAWHAGMHSRIPLSRKFLPSPGRHIVPFVIR